MTAEVEVQCPYCQGAAELLDDAVIYGRGYGSKIWMCEPCDAYVGTHRNSRNMKPLGSLANKELRTWRIKVHTLFDPMWMKKMKRDNCKSGEARDAAYEWLGKNMGMDLGKCHVAWFRIAECKRAIAILERAGNGKRK